VLLVQRDGKFSPAQQDVLRVSARSSGAVLVDLDNDGDPDLYLSNLGGGDSGHQATPNKLFRNDGGRFTDVSQASGACPPAFRGRSVAALDFDGDGLLDLLVGESLAYGSEKRSRLLRNRGKLGFEDITEPAGLGSVPALGVAVGDVNDDGWPDLLLAAAEGGNRLFLNEKGQRVREANQVSALLQAAWKYSSGDDTTSAACLADVNRDGRLDILIGHHFERPWLTPVAARLYLQREGGGDEPSFVDATERAGLVPLPMKAAHLEVQDFDNDGWPDVYVSMVKFAEGKVHPLVFRNRGVGESGVYFKEQMLGVNDYPTAEDRRIESTGQFFAKLIKERKMIYTAAAPSADFDGDGRVDLFLSSWWTEAPALLLKNETSGGNWLDVHVRGDGKALNRDGIGAKVAIYSAGQAGRTEALLGMVEIASGYGYSSGQVPVAHFGLGTVTDVDLVITMPHGAGVWKRTGVQANQRLTIKSP
jgi:hypothetical protein